MDCHKNRVENPFRTGSLACCLLVVGLFSMAWPGRATAANEGLGELICEDSLVSTDAPTDVAAQLQHLQQQIDMLRSMPPANPIPCCPATDCPQFPTARLTGFFQADAIWFSQSLANQIAVGNGVAADGDAQDGADFRRARLAAVGEVWNDVSYSLEMDFGFPGRPSFMDVWLQFDDVGRSSQLRIGQFRQPFGMDGLTSVKELTFLERALPFAFLPFRQIGAMLSGSNRSETATWAVSGFRYPTDVYGGNVGDNGGYAMATRLTGVLLQDCQQNCILHLGGGYSYLDPSNDRVQYRNQPEVFVGETGGAALVPTGVPSNVPPFVDTGIINTQHVNLVSAELAFSYRSFYAQSEAIFANVDQMGGPSLTFPGAYVYAAYLLTGETRPYNGKTGVFGRVKPRCSVGRGGIGCWELAARWSYIDLNDQNIRGNRLNDLTTGLNWYLNPYTKFQWNYIHAMLNSDINGDSDADILAMRAQIDF